MAGKEGEAAAEKLAQELLPLARHHELELLRGNKVLELRPRGIHKGIIADALARGTRPRPLMVAMGDDRTDEDLFAAMPDGGIAIHIGPTPSAAPWRLADVPAARRFLEELVASESTAAPGGRKPAGVVKGRKRAT
jgi:trehalose 6-phosphate synthase/phosphatase